MQCPAPRIVPNTIPGPWESSHRIYQHAAQTDRLVNTLDVSTLPTIWDRLADSGVTRKYSDESRFQAPCLYGVSPTHLSEIILGSVPQITPGAGYRCEAVGKCRSAP